MHENTAAKLYHARPLDLTRLLVGQPQILSVLGGAPLDTAEDYPYDLDGYSKAAVKLAVSAAFNAEEEAKAWSGARRRLQDDIWRYEAKRDIAREKRDYYQASKLSRKITELETALNEIGKKRDFQELIAAFVKRFPVFEPCLYKSMWGELQKIDSDICMTVIEALKAKGIVVLTIHDSFIVECQHEHELREAVREAYRAHPKLNGTIPTLRTEKESPVDSVSDTEGIAKGTLTTDWINPQVNHMGEGI